jgi:hypothetical protein
MHVITAPNEFQVVTDAYRLVVSRDAPRALLHTTGEDGREVDWGSVCLLASVDRTDCRDESYVVEKPVLAEREDTSVVFEVQQKTTAWRHKTVLLTCTTETVEVQVRVEGGGAVSDVCLLGGRAVLATGAAGVFRSGSRARSIFNPAPTQPVHVVRPAAAPVALGIVGDAEPGRLNGLFSPPPLVVAFGTQEPTGPTQVPHGDWLAASVRAEVGDLTFTQMTYEPLDGGYLMRFDYEGHTAVDGSWTSPTLVLRPAATPWQAVADHRADLVGHGCAPAGPVHESHDWWRHPLFCGWGAQCARAAVGDGTSAADLARQDVYDAWLTRLAEHGLSPGTVVVDDRWQVRYGLPEPDPDKWPDLRGWVADQHAAGRRVLLWWRAWSPDGLPAQECITDAVGRPVAADPTNPAYLRRLQATMAELLGANGLGADGLKVDFTQRAPSGATLACHGGSWGLALLHRMLAVMYAAAKRAKPDALMVTQTPHPSFADVCDMVRLNDVLDSDSSGHPVPVVDQLRFRHAVATHALPYHLVDTDQWPMPNRAEWLAYAEAQAALGVPALYYVESIDNSGEQITSADLARVASTWRSYCDG